MSNISGFDNLTKFFNKTDTIDETITDALLNCGNDLQQKSQDLTPIDTGALKASSFTEQEQGNSIPTIEVGYEEEYAIYVHEDLEAQHPNGGQAKFLEQPFKENEKNYINYISKKIEEKLK